ncbi:hypothetical protein PRZ48_008748 [Zasmidium cellare]|uniref:BTB domain-containing protein n=1 Tax=Zasmidium cellare TaxID=395010 RepID=A0ABR0EGD9_ZASCE|nr:hypothetical protein PRZ48_008748 [Zasmidium cellare]
MAFTRKRARSTTKDQAETMCRNDVNSSTIEVFSFSNLETPYTVHKGLISREARDVTRKLEGHDNVIKIEPQPLLVFLAWLYLGRICRPQNDLSDTISYAVHHGPHPKTEILQDYHLADTFIFAQENGLHKLKNDVMTQLILQHEETGHAVADDAQDVVRKTLGIKNSFSEFAIIAEARYIRNTTVNMKEILEFRNDHRLAQQLDMSTTHDPSECECAKLARAEPDKRICYFHEHHSPCQITACRRRLRALGAPNQVVDDE